MESFLTQSKTPSKRAITEVPKNLDELSRDQLLDLVTSLASERDELSRKRSKVDVDSSQKKPKKDQIQTTLAPPKKAPSINVTSIKKRILLKSIKAIKKTKHNDKRKPYTEVTEGLSSKEDAMMLLEDFPMTSSTPRMTKWMLGPGEIERFLGCESTIHPVAFDGKV